MLAHAFDEQPSLPLVVFRQRSRSVIELRGANSNAGERQHEHLDARIEHLQLQFTADRRPPFADVGIIVRRQQC